MKNSADPDQLASSEGNWSGTTLFSKPGHMRVQHDTFGSLCPKGFMIFVLHIGF